MKLLHFIAVVAFFPLVAAQIRGHVDRIDEEIISTEEFDKHDEIDNSFFVRDLGVGSMPQDEGSKGSKSPGTKGSNGSKGSKTSTSSKGSKGSNGTKSSTGSKGSKDTKPSSGSKGSKGNKKPKIEDIKDEQRLEKDPDRRD